VLAFPQPGLGQNVAVDRPLVTDTARVAPAGSGLLGLGAEVVRLPGDDWLTSAPVLSGRFGLAPVVELSATYRWLWRDGGGQGFETGTGDLFLFTKIQLLDGRGTDGTESAWPPAALRLGVKLPNASARDRLGTNNTDFSMLGLVTPTFGPLELRLAGGLQILESPFDPLAQHDATTLAAAALLPVGHGLTPFVEYYGQWLNRDEFELEEARAGLRWERRRLRLDLAGSVGLSGASPRGFAGELSREWGVTAGATLRVGLPGYRRFWGR
jgi:hypothetical protein